MKCILVCSASFLTCAFVCAENTVQTALVCVAYGGRTVIFRTEAARKQLLKFSSNLCNHFRPPRPNLAITRITAYPDKLGTGSHPQRQDPTDLQPESLVASFTSAPGTLPARASAIDSRRPFLYSTLAYHCRLCPPPPASRDASMYTQSPSSQAQLAGSPSARRRYACTQCERSFTTSGHLARHTRVHTGERNHKCPFPGCETRCSRQDNLQQQ